MEKTSFTTTAFGGEIVLGPVKEFVQFFCQMTEVIFCYFVILLVYFHKWRNDTSFRCYYST